jgi:hypothetical protein
LREKFADSSEIVLASVSWHFIYPANPLVRGDDRKQSIGIGGFNAGIIQAALHRAEVTLLRVRLRAVPN